MFCAPAPTKPRKAPRRDPTATEGEYTTPVPTSFKPSSHNRLVQENIALAHVSASSSRPTTPMQSPAASSGDVVPQLAKQLRERASSVTRSRRQSAPLVTEYTTSVPSTFSPSSFHVMAKQNIARAQELNRMAASTPVPGVTDSGSGGGDDASSNSRRGHKVHSTAGNVWDRLQTDASKWIDSKRRASTALTPTSSAPGSPQMSAGSPEASPAHSGQTKAGLPRPPSRRGSACRATLIQPFYTRNGCVQTSALRESDLMADGDERAAAVAAAMRSSEDEHERRFNPWHQSSAFDEVLKHPRGSFSKEPRFGRDAPTVTPCRARSPSPGPMSRFSAIAMAGSSSMV